MKPELIFVNEKDGTVMLSKEDLERIVDSAYKAGQADSSYITTTPWTVHPTWTDGTMTVPVKRTDITCHEGNWAEGTQTKG